MWTINPLCKFEEIFWNHKKCTIFDENSCLALSVTSYLVRFGKICLATASRHCSTHQLNTLYQWCDLSWPFLTLKTTQKSRFFGVAYICKPLSLLIYILVDERSKAPVASHSCRVQSPPGALTCLF